MSALSATWTRLGPRFLPFAEAAGGELPLRRLLRLSLFQVSAGMVAVLLIGTLNRVMIVELAVPAWLVAVMVSLPLAFAPFRALIGLRSDHHRSVLGWRRVPYFWMGTLLQFGGLAIMPFALILLSGDSNGPAWIGHAGAALAFLMVGAGLHTAQTAGMALAADITPPAAQPRMVALLAMMQMLGMLISALAFGLLLARFSQLRLIQVVQGTAMATMALNLVALWKQEARDPRRTRGEAPAPGLLAAWATLPREGRWLRRLVALGLGAAAFSMQDILLEPYGGQILGLSVAETTRLTALFAGSGILAFGLAARQLARRADPHRLAALGALAGIVGFLGIIFAAPLGSTLLFGGGVALVGFGGGLFTVGTLTACVGLARGTQGGLVLGAWGAVQASAAGGAVACGGVLRDAVSGLANHGLLGPALMDPTTGYGTVYLLEVVLLFATIIALGPLVRSTAPAPATRNHPSLGLAGQTS